MAMNTSYFEPPLNMDRVCRICLLEGTNLSPIFCTEQDVNEFSGLSQKIQACGSIEIHENDGFPSLICDVCIYKASIAHEFRQLCQQSDARLRLIYDKPNETNISTEPQTRIILTTRKIPSPSSSTYYVKQELQSSSSAPTSQDYASAIEAYTDSHVENVVRSNDQPIDCQDEKLFLCNIGFGETKEITTKQSDIITTESDHRIIECPLVQTNISTTLMTVNVNGQLETRQLIVKDDSQKCDSTVLEDEYMSEQMLNETVSTVIEAAAAAAAAAADQEDFEEQQQEALLRQQQQQQHHQHVETRKKRTSSRRIKSSSYSDNEHDNDDNYFSTTMRTNEQTDSRAKYKCNVCLKHYRTQNGLKNHIRVHEKNHKCPICHKTFYKINNMEKHVKIHETKPYACQTCHTSFTRDIFLSRHLKTHDEEKIDDTTRLTKVSCSTRDEMKEEMEIFKNNEINEVDNEIYVEEDNNEEDEDEDDNHVENNEVNNVNEIDSEGDDDDAIDARDDDDTAILGNDEIDEFSNAPGLYRCKECEQFCSSLKNLKRHSLVHGEKKYSCTVCKKAFFRPDTLKKHAEKHGHGLLDNLCDSDNKLFDSDDDNFTSSTIVPIVVRTNESHKASRDEITADDDAGIGEYKCQHCDKIMASKKGLRRHVSMHKPKAEPVTCNVCKKICASQARLGLHLKTHNKPKEKIHREYLCHICSKVYPSNSSLTYHMRTHSGVKPHVCKICNSGFTTTTSLANHIRIHTGDKPFVCHVCSAAFAVSSAFRRHLTRHTGEANYLCKTCGKAFKRLSTLKEHTYTHSGEKPYVCKTCGAAYSHSGSLFAHQKRCRVQYGEMVEDHNVAHHIHVNNVQTAVRSLAVLGQMY